MLAVSTTPQVYQRSPRIRPRAVRVPTSHVQNWRQASAHADYQLRVSGNAAVAAGWPPVRAPLEHLGRHSYRMVAPGPRSGAKRARRGNVRGG